MGSGSSNLGLSIDGGLECQWPFFIDVRMSDTRIVDHHAATTRVYEDFNPTLLGYIQHILCAFKVDIPYLLLKSAAEPFGQIWDDSSSVDNDVWFHSLKCSAQCFS